MKGFWIHVCLVITENHQDFILISICTQGGGYSRFQVTGMTKGFLEGRTILVGMMKKQTQAINFYFFVISFNAFWTFLRFRNSSWDFFGINFLSRDFSSGFGGSPRYFVWFLFLPPFDHPCHLKSPPPPQGHVLVRTLGLSLLNDQIFIWTTGNFTVDNKPIVEF